MPDVDRPARVKVQPNGPYVVSGAVPVTRATIVASDEGGPSGWRDHRRPGSSHRRRFVPLRRLRP